VGQDFVGCLGPGELVAVFPAVDEAAARGREFLEVGGGAAPDGLRVMIPKRISTMFIQEPEVGVKCSVIRGFLASQA
jgi:hypothetical protein